MEPILISDADLATTKIGFVGLGHMGGNMAARFLAGGYTVYGESRDRRHAEDLEHEGLKWRGTPREVADAADVVFTSVPTTMSSRPLPPVPTGSSRAFPRERSG